VIVKFAQDGDGRRNIEATNLDGEDEHASDGTILETVFVGEGLLGCGIEGTGKGGTQGRVVGLRQPTEFGQTTKDVRFGVNLAVVPGLLYLCGIEENHGCCGTDERDCCPNAVHDGEAIIGVSGSNKDVVDLAKGKCRTKANGVVSLVDGRLGEGCLELEWSGAFRIEMRFPPVSGFGVALICLVQGDVGAEGNILRLS
jgi:hypothetical protein